MILTLLWSVRSFGEILAASDAGRDAAESVAPRASAVARDARAAAGSAASGREPEAAAVGSAARSGGAADAEAGADAVLVGEALMRASDKKKKLAKLRGLV